MKHEGINCKFCDSPNIVKNGVRRGTQYWLCKNCGRGFVDNKALPRMRFNIVSVASAVYQYYTGWSMNEIRGHIQQRTGIRPSDSTVYNWVTRFSKIAIYKAKEYKPKVHRVWLVSETVLRIGGKKFWLWDVIDSDTRFILASYLSPSKTIDNVQKLIEYASQRADKAPKVIITDKLSAYIDSIELIFGAETKTIQSRLFTVKDSTNLIGSFRDSVKDRTKVMLGIKRLERAQFILDGWLVYYNFFGDRETLSDKSEKTPAEKTGIRFPFRNWLDIVKSQFS